MTSFLHHSSRRRRVHPIQDLQGAAVCSAPAFSRGAPALFLGPAGSAKGDGQELAEGEANYGCQAHQEEQVDQGCRWSIPKNFKYHDVHEARNPEQDHLEADLEGEPLEAGQLEDSDLGVVQRGEDEADREEEDEHEGNGERGSDHAPVNRIDVSLMVHVVSQALDGLRGQVDDGREAAEHPSEEDRLGHVFLKARPGKGPDLPAHEKAEIDAGEGDWQKKQA